LPLLLHISDLEASLLWSVLNRFHEQMDTRGRSQSALADRIEGLLVDMETALPHAGFLLYGNDELYRTLEQAIRRCGDESPPQVEKLLRPVALRLNALRRLGTSPQAAEP
jgi:CHASE3 domain sensor protein